MPRRYCMIVRKESSIFVGVTFERNLNWYKHVADLAIFAVKKLGLLFRTREYLFSFSNFQTMHVSQLRPNPQYYSYIQGAARPTILHLPDSVQKKSIKLIRDPAHSSKLLLPAHRRTVNDLFFPSIIPWVFLS